MKNDTTFSEAAAAHAKVRAAIEGMRADYAATNTEIASVEAELDALPKLAIPFDDMKAAILEFVTESGKRHTHERVRGAIAKFATHYNAGVSFDPATLGKPLSYGELEAAINGDTSAASYTHTHLLTGGYAAVYDQSLFTVAGDLARLALAAVMEDMTPDEFGYDRIDQNKIGTPRAERRQRLEALRAQLALLIEKKASLAKKLRELGFSVPIDARAMRG